MAEVKKVVFATNEATVHILLKPEPSKDQFGNETYITESRVLLPGQFVEQSAVPPYLLEKIKGGTAPGLEFMTEKKAKEVAAKAAAIRDIADSSLSVQGIPSESEASKESFKLAMDAAEEETE